MRVLVWVLSWLLPVCAIAAAPVPAVTPSMAATAQQLLRQAAQGSPGYDIVESLTTEVGPRLAGSAAEARARQWAVQKLVALGLRNVRVENFEVPVWQRGAERAEIVAPFPQPLVVTALGGSAATGPDGVEAEVVAFASVAALQAAPQDSVQGKIVFIDEPMARSRDGSGYGVAVTKRLVTAYVAQQLGAVGALIRSVGTGDHRFPHTGQMRPAGGSGPDGVPAAALAQPDADQLQRALSRGQPVIVRLVITPQRLPRRNPEMSLPR
ncbi:MAG: PA domain-containing protein [Halioglobus sp.]